MRALVLQLCLVGTMFAAAACIPPPAPALGQAVVTVVTDDTRPPLYGGCKEWRPAYGPKPRRCRG
jgi:hypothetical protein